MGKNKLQEPFMDSILTGESSSVKPYTYRAKVLRGIDIVLKEDYNGKPVKKFECASYEQAKKLALKLMKQAPLPEPFEEGEKVARKCSVTGEGMNEGWVANDGDEYFKYEEDAIAWCKQNLKKSLKKAYDEGEIYWTEWDVEDDAQYIVKNGKVVEIEEEQTENQKLLSIALDALYKLEDRTGYENKKLGKCINNLQKLINKI